MPRDSNGNYTLPAGNPVVSGTTIDTGWANPTLSDVANELTNSLDRNGRGAMLAPFKFLDGTSGLPGITWTAEPSTGLYRAGASDMRVTVAGVPLIRWTGTGVAVWDLKTSTWVSLTTVDGVNVAILNAQNAFTQSQKIVGGGGDLSFKLWKDATPTLAGRFGFGTATADALDLSYFNGSGWRPRLLAGAANMQHYATQHIFWDEPGNVRFGSWTEDKLEVSRNAAGFATARITSNTSSISANDGTSLDFYEGVTPVGFIRCYRDGLSTMRLMNMQTGPLIFGVNNIEAMLLNSSGLRLLGARSLQFYNAAGDDLSSVSQVGTSLNFNTGTANSFQFFPGSAAVARFVSGGLETLSGASVVVRAVGNAKTLTIAHDGSNGYLQVGSGAGGIYSYVAGVARFWVTDTTVNIPAGASFFLGTYAAFSESQTSRKAPIVRDVNGWHGGAWYWSDAWVNGTVFTGTGPPPATDEPGSIYLQYEIA